MYCEVHTAHERKPSQLHIGTFEPNSFQISKSCTGFELHYSSSPIGISARVWKKGEIHKKFEFVWFMQLIFNQISRDLMNNGMK